MKSMATITIFFAGYLAAAASLTGCFAPPVLRGGGLPDFQLDRFPPGAEAVEIPIGDDGERLRGVYLPGDDPEAPLVVHYMPTGAGVSSGWRGSPRFQLMWSLRDRGFSLLMADYRGVGASDGVGAASQVADDAWAIYGEAVRRAGGSERIVLRGNSLGGLAVGSLLERGVSPLAVVLVAPVLDDNVVYNVGRRHYGTVIAWLADALIFRDPTGIDLLGALREVDTSEILVITADADEFLGSDGLERFEHAMTETRGRATFVVEGPGLSHIDIGIEGQLLLPAEAALYDRVHPRESDADAVVASRLSGVTANRGDPPAELAFVAAHYRLDPPRAAIPAAEFLAQRSVAALDVAIDWFRALPGHPPTDDEALDCWFDFEDPAGPLDPAELEWCLRFAFRQPGSDSPPDLDQLVRLAKTARLHRRLFRYLEDPRGFERAWRFPKELDLDRAVDSKPLEGIETLPLRATLPPNDALRHVVRLLLKARRIPERTRITPDGAVILEVRDDPGGWRELPLPDVSRVQ